MISQIISTLRNSLRTKPYLYLLILLTQIVSLLCVFFSCGLIYNAFTEYEEADIDSRYIYADFINTYDDSKSDDEKYGNGLSYDDFQLGIENIMSFLESNRSDIMVHGRIKLDGEYHTVSSFYNNLTGSDDNYGPYDIIASIEGYDVGDYIKIDGVSYHIVGLSETSDLCFPLGENTPPSVVPCNMGIELEHQPTYQECKSITDSIQMFFNPINIEEPEILELLDVQMNNTQIALSAVLLIIVSVNCGICYNYINNSRRKQFAIYKICGAETYHCFIVCISEVILYMFMGFAFAYLIFEYKLKQVLASFYPNIKETYTANAYVHILMAYAVITLIVMSAGIIKYARRPIVEERKQL